jgi:5-amino-6-(5-phosphoribosylamino)uracil reductase
VPDRFAAYASASHPGTIVSCAVSVDGYLDDATQDRLILSGPEDLDEVDALRAGADAILVGAGTIRKDNPRLLVRDPARVAAREAAGRAPHPFRVTLTSSGNLNPSANFFLGPGMPLVYCPAGVGAKAMESLEDKAKVVEVAPELTLAAVLADLYQERGVMTLLVEGGARILRDLLAADLVDELRLAIAPFFVADPRAPRFALPARYPHTVANPMTLVSVRRVGEVAVHHYRLTDRPRPDKARPDEGPESRARR